LRRLAAEPLCRHCADRGIIRAAVTPDHIIPLGLGGSDDDSNIQCLCEECHAIKTAGEDVTNQGASNHPDWLKPSAIPITIVCGPPCSGKTTYVEQQAGPSDIVIDIDAIALRLSPTYKQWTGALTFDLTNRAIRVRNAMLGSLVSRVGGKAWLIVSAPTEHERAWWQRKLGGVVVLLNPGKEECKRRAIARATPLAIAGVERWEIAARRPWKKSQRYSIVDEDGWPIVE